MGMPKATETKADATEVATEQSMDQLVQRALGYVKGTVFFEEAITEYGNGPKFGVSVQFQWDPDADDDQWLAAARATADRAKAFVWEQLGIDAYRDEDGILVRAGLTDLMRGFPGSTIEHSSDVEQAAPAADDSVGKNPPYFDSKFKDASFDEKKTMFAANREWAKARYKTHPSEFKDNRDAKASGEVPQNAPDFSHKTHWKSGFYEDS